VWASIDGVLVLEGLYLKQQDQKPIPVTQVCEVLHFTSECEKLCMDTWLKLEKCLTKFIFRKRT